MIIDTNSKDPQQLKFRLPLMSYDYTPVVNDLVDVRGEGNCFYHAILLGLRTLDKYLVYQNTNHLRNAIKRKLEELLGYDEKTGRFKLNTMFNDVYQIKA